MDFSSPPVKPELMVDSQFDIQGFKNLLDTLKESKKQQEDKARPTYYSEN